MASKPAFLIAITGGSGSGKSTIAEALMQRCNSPGITLFREDGYYWPSSHYGPIRDEAHRLSIIAETNYDAPQSKELARMTEDLIALKAGQSIEQPIYDFDRHDRVADDTLRLEPAPIILLEGIHVLSIEEIKPLIDLAIYVDTPDDLRLARRIRRDVIERGRDVHGVLNQYLKTVRAAHYRYTYPAMFEADLVIADEGLPAYGQVQADKDAIERMLAPIMARLESRGVL
ncbi:MAG: uridine kinase [Pseudomonadota bacterium]